MKYMLMMHAPRAGWSDAGIGTWPPDDIKAHIEFMLRLQQGADGVGRARRRAGPRRPGGGARSCARGKDGAPAVTDGPFAEAKEFLAGYWIVDCREHRARVRDRRARVGGARQGRRAAEHADRSARR